MSFPRLFPPPLAALSAAFIAVMAAIAAAPAAGEPAPRMASLRVDEANVRTGPGRRYPIQWVYRSNGMPVEIVEEEGFWRRIRDWEGAEGWVLHSLLSNRRTLLVLEGPVMLRRGPRTADLAVARLAAGVTARIRRCDPGWCHVEVGELEGWIRREGLWGLRPDEVIN